MSKFERKIRRQKEKEASKRERKVFKNADQDLGEKVGLFNKLPESCMMCFDSFDKTNREMVASWSVVVRPEEDKVNLYCPDCWDNAQKIIREFQESLNERNN
jgi:hypothetical protein